MNKIKLLPYLMVFAEVSHYESFTLAAKKLNMSKSSVSQQIKKLEEHIGQQLLSRHTRGMALTEAGKSLLNRCTLLRDQLDYTFDEIDYNKEVPSGSFAITVPHSCEQKVVIPALNQLCIEYPNIEPNVQVSDKVRDLINDDFDVAIRVGTLKDCGYRAMPIGSTGESFCVSPSYLDKNGSIDKLEQLLQHRFIGTPWQSKKFTLYDQSSKEIRITANINMFSKTNRLPTTLEMVLQGMGVALLPDFVVEPDISSGKLVRVLTQYKGGEWPFYYVHRFYRDKPAHIDRFYQLVKQFFLQLNKT